MCGFINVIGLTKKGRKLIDTNFYAAANSIQYRGPDQTTIFDHYKSKCCFHRLSIIDIENGQQPLYSKDKKILLLFNGYISNYKEINKNYSIKEESDSKVILRLYELIGTDIIHVLKGMYAIYIYDENLQKVIFFRDLYGIKPMYYLNTEDMFSVSSEIKALKVLNENVTLNLDEVLDDPRVSINNKFSKEIKSFVDEIDIVAPGKIYTYDLSNNLLSSALYWDFNKKTNSKSSMKKEEILYNYYNLLEIAVKRNSFSDSEIDKSIMLSGGIDSATILSKLNPKGKCFTVKTEATYLNGEIQSAIMTSNYFDTELYQIDIEKDLNKIEDKARLYKDLLWIVETPLFSADHLLKFFLFKNIKGISPNTKIVFSGQGSDEFNGGYSKMHAFEDNWESFIFALCLKDNISKQQSLDNWRMIYDDIFSLPDTQDLYDKYLHSMYIDLQMYNCHAEDRLASFWGLENRVPFLDYDLVNFSINLSENEQQILYNKNLLRESMKDDLPEHLYERKKTAFFYGEGEKKIKELMFSFYTYNDWELLQEISSYGFVNLQKTKQSIIKLLENDNAIYEPLLRFLNACLLKIMYVNEKKDVDYLKKGVYK